MNRKPESIDPPLRDLVAPRLSPIAAGEGDGKEANRLRHDPMVQLSVERVPLEPAQDLARAPTFSRLAHRVTRPALSRLPPAFVDHCMARSPEPPAAMGRGLDPSAAPPHGPQALPGYHHPYQRYGSLPLCIVAGPSHALVTAGLRPG